MVDIVAEIGANWKGNYSTLDRMIERCAKAGCNAVKFQALSQSLLDRHPEWDWYVNASINEVNVGFVAGLCREYKIEFFCTPTYPEAVTFLNPYVKRWKIRHADKDYEELLLKCMNTLKPIYVSRDRPLEKPLNTISYIYCVPKYPTEYGELNFDMIKLMPGFSCHCLDPLAILRAVRYGAKYIEFHLTDNKDDFAIDNKVSYTYSQMEELIKWMTMDTKDT